MKSILTSIGQTGSLVKLKYMDERKNVKQRWAFKLNTTSAATKGFKGSNLRRSFKHSHAVQRTASEFPA